MVCPTCFAAWGIFGTIFYFIYCKLFKRGCAKPEIQEKDWKKDTVYLYQFPRPSMLPNHSPFCLKLESFCRLYKIPFEVRYTSRKSKNGLLPYVELNGEHIADSQLIMLHLQKHFKTPELSERDEAIARAVDRMVDTHTIMTMVKPKYIDHPENIELVLSEMDLPDFLKSFMWIIAKIFQCKVSKRMKVVLGGKFGDADMRLILGKDLAAIKGILGDQKFLMGDTPTWVDCTVFSHLATLYYLPTSNIVKDFINIEYPTLAEYMERTKQVIYGADFGKH